MDAYIVFFALVGLSMMLLGLNMIATIVTMRAPGLTWSRLHLLLGRAPTSLRCCSPLRADRGALHGGARPNGADELLHPGRRRQPVPLENLFWVFGHPEVYILALPGFAVVLELLPVFARKPLWGTGWRSRGCSA